MPVLVLGAICISGVWAGYQYNKSPGGSAAKRAQENHAPLEASSVISVSKFLNDYIKANYAAGIDLSQKIRMTGTYSSGSRIQAFSGIFDFQGNGRFFPEFAEAVEFEFSNGA